MGNLIIGTAGHVDHGKTMLIKALTGIDTDRLKVEKDRGISIELGFAFCRLPSGRLAGIVDVPGHERFIKNMLAGVGGIDLVLLVIAADEGVMPQTKEHMEIIQLLQIKHGVVALTKVDLVDQEFLELVKESVKDFLKDTFLKDAPVVEVSSVSGNGLNELLKAIDLVAFQVEKKSTEGPVRLPVDRVFSITGFGTIVTGTLWSGIIHLGDNLEIMPEGYTVRVRSLEVHGKKVKEARAGQRVAANIPGVEVEQVSRGSVLAAPGIFKPTQRLDVRLTLLKDVPGPLKHRSRVRFYLGTAEVFGRVVLLDREELKPGEATYAQLLLEDATVAFRGDRFILRSYSPMRTIGGGMVIDPLPKKRRRMQDGVIQELLMLEKGKPEELVQHALRQSKKGLLTVKEIAQSTGINPEDLRSFLSILFEKGKIRKIKVDNEEFFVLEEIYTQWVDELKEMLEVYHKENPLRDGFSKEELRSRIFSLLSSKQFQSLLKIMEEQEVIKVDAQTVALPGFYPMPDSNQQKVLEKIESNYKELGLQPPKWEEVAGKVVQTQELLHYCLRQGILIKIAEDLYFHSDAVEEAKKRLLEFLKEKGEIAVGQARDIWQTSRKYALPLLEYFDRLKITKRVGDKRKIR